MSLHENLKQNWTLILKWAITIIVPFMIFLIPTTESYTIEIKLFMVATLWAICMWATEVTNTLIPALILPVAYILFKVITPAQAFSSWSATTIWIVLGGMLICEVFNDTGLMKRIAYFCIIKAGGTYRGVIFGLTLSGFIMALLIPTLVGRAVIYAGLTYGLCVGLNIPVKSRTSAGLMLGGYFAAANPAYIFSTGSNITLIGLQNLSLYGYEVTFSEYFLHMGPIAVAWAFLVAILLPFILKQDHPLGDKAYFKNEYEELGKMTGPEKKAMLILLVAVLLVATNSLHKIDPAWCFIIAAAVCFLPFLHIADQKLMSKVNYPTLIFIAACLSIGNAANAVGASTFVANLLSPFLHIGGNYFTLGVCWIISVVVNLLMTPLAAISSMVTPLIEIAIQVGVNPCAVVYTFVQGLEQLFFPYEVAPALITFSFGMISMHDFTKVFLSKTVVAFVFLLVIMIPYWSIIGLL